MPVDNFAPNSVVASTNFTPTSGTLLSCIQARGSGEWDYNFDHFTSSIQVDFDTSSIPSGATILSVTGVVSVACSNGSSGTGVDPLEINADPGIFNSGPLPGPVSFGDVAFLYPDPVAQPELSSILLRLGVGSNDGLTLCEYMGLQILWTNDPPEGLCMIWCAGAIPADCPQPAPRRFAPLGLFDLSAGVTQNITAAYLYKYGKPPPGFNLWSYYRTLTGDLIPDSASPSSPFLIPLW